MVELEFVRTYSAPRQLVWDAWTDPDQIAQWWGPRGIKTPRESIELDLRPGGRIAFDMVDEATGHRYPNSGTILELDPPARLVWSDDGFADGSGKGTATVTFTELNASTHQAHGTSRRGLQRDRPRRRRAGLGHSAGQAGRIPGRRAREGVHTEDGEGVLTNEPGPETITVLITATSYPFFNILWETLIFFAWVIFIWIAITVLIDVFRRRDISGWAKAAWVIFVVLIPWIGVLVYLIVNHDGMAERKISEAQASQAQFDEYVRKTAGGSSGGAAAEIEKAKGLLDNGTITQAEFDAIKARALA